MIMMELGVVLILWSALGVAVPLLATRCERITAPMCQQLGYNTTLMPNMMGHDNQEDAIEEVRNFGVFLVLFDL